MSARTVGWFLWLTLGGLAALALLWQIRNPPQPPTVHLGPSPELPVPPPLGRFQLAPASRYGEVTARPLFIAERRPEPPPPPDDAALPKKSPADPEQKFILFGVMIAPEIRAALLRVQEPNAKTARIKLGDLIGEWRLDAVFPDRVVLRKGGETQDLPLTRPRKPAKPRVKRTGAQPGQQDAVPPANAPIGPGGMPVVPPEALPPPVGAAPPQ
jgi:general secretion pathway protein N